MLHVSDAVNIDISSKPQTTNIIHLLCTLFLFVGLQKIVSRTTENSLKKTVWVSLFG